VEGLHKRYLKFSKRLRRAPEQCMRHGLSLVPFTACTQLISSLQPLKQRMPA
jgi:hypothetical protein